MVETWNNTNLAHCRGWFGVVGLRLVSLLVGLGTTALVGCSAQTTSTGSVVVPYVLGNMRTCKDMGIDVVQGVLDDQFLVLEVPCEEGRIRFVDLPEGLYRVALFGLSEDGYSVMDSLGPEAIIIKVPGQGVSATVEPAILLTAAPAHLQIRWDFGFSSCAGAGVESFMIRAWNPDGRDLLLEETLPCESNGSGSQQYRDVPDFGRNLGGTLVGQVSVSALRDDGTPFGPPVGFNFEPPGSGRRIQLTLKCNGSGCEGVGKPETEG